MSFDAGSIMGRVGLNVSPFAQSMLEAGSIARSFPPIVQSFIANPLLAVVDIARGVGRAIGGAFTEATTFADDMGDLAQSIGVGVQALTGLGFVASLAGSNAEEVASSYRFLGRSIQDALENADSEAGKTFNRLGVRLLEADGSSRSLENVMLDLADAFTRLPEGAARTSAAMDLLGRGGTAMLPTLLQGSQAIRDQMAQMDRYGVTVTQVSQISADKWNDAMGEMGLAFRGLRQSIAEPIRDALLPTLLRVLEWTRENQPIIRAAIIATVEAVVAGMHRVADAIGFVQQHADQFLVGAAALGGFLGGGSFLGVLLNLAPAFLGLVNPIRSVSIAIGLLMTSINPLQLVLKLAAAGLAAFAVYAAQNPAVLEAMRGAAAQLHQVLNDLWGMVQANLIPVVGEAWQRAMDWIVPKMPAIAAAVADVWQRVQGFAAYIAATAVPVLQDLFASAWAALASAIDATWPYVQQAWDVLGGLIDWVTGTAAPAVGAFFAEAWNAAQPVVRGMEALFGSLWESVLLPFAGWVRGTLFPMLVEQLGGWWAFAQPIFAGLGSVISGIWELTKGVLSWLEPVFKWLAGQISIFSGVVSSVWTGVLQPVIDWIWSAVRPALEFVGNTVGWLLGKVGDLIGWLGKAINLSDDLGESGSKLPIPPAASGGAPATNAIAAGAFSAAGQNAAGLASRATGAPVINANVPAIDETRLASAIGAVMEPKIEQNIRDAANAAKAAAYARRVGRAL